MHSASEDPSTKPFLFLVSFPSMYRPQNVCLRDSSPCSSPFISCLQRIAKSGKTQIPYPRTLRSQGLVSRAFFQFEGRHLADDPIDSWCWVLADTHTCPVMEKDPLLTAGRVVTHTCSECTCLGKRDCASPLCMWCYDLHNSTAECEGVNFSSNAYVWKCFQKWINVSLG